MIKPSRDTYDQHQSSKFLLLCNCNITFSYTALFYFLNPSDWCMVYPLDWSYPSYRSSDSTKKRKGRQKNVKEEWSDIGIEMNELLRWKDFTYSLIKSYPSLFRRKGWYLLKKNVMPTLAQNIKFLYEKIIYILLINKECNHKR